MQIKVRSNGVGKPAQQMPFGMVIPFRETGGKAAASEKLSV